MINASNSNASSLNVAPRTTVLGAWVRDYVNDDARFTLIMDGCDEAGRITGTLHYYDNVLTFVANVSPLEARTFNLDDIDACMSCGDAVMFNYMFDDDEATFALVAIH